MSVDGVTGGGTNHRQGFSFTVEYFTALEGGEISLCFTANEIPRISQGVANEQNPVDSD